MTTPTVHLVCGRVGAGKTTHARVFARERGAVLLCLDEWMLALFTPDAPVPITLEWAMPRVERCERMMWTVSQSVLALGTDVVIEAGFFLRAQRDRWREWVADAGYPVSLHHVTADREVRRQRVRARNQGGDTLTVQVDDGMFDWAEGYFEPLDEGELRGAVLVATG